MQEQRKKADDSAEMEQLEHGNFRQTVSSLNVDCDRRVGGISLNRVAALEHEQTGSVAILKEKEMEEEVEEEAEAKEEAPVAAAALQSVSGVRKKLSQSAEEALEGVRQTAELIVKDAMDALQRTKQRLMEILPNSLVAPTSSAPAAAAAAAVDKASKAVEGAKDQLLAKSKVADLTSPSEDEPDNQENEKIEGELISKTSGSVSTEPAMSFMHPLRQRPSSSDVVERSGLHSKL